MATPKHKKAHPLWKILSHLAGGLVVLVFALNIIVRLPSVYNIHLKPSIPVPDALFLSPTSEKTTLQQFAGKPIILHFWATWCGPCVHEMPKLDSYAAQLKDQPVHIIPIAIDFNGQEVVKRFFEQHSISHLSPYTDYAHSLYSAMGVRGLPSTIFINANGMEIARTTGALAWESGSVDNFIQTLINHPTLTSPIGE